MKIPLSREIKLTLLQWLRDGQIDLLTLQNLQRLHTLTDEAIQEELDRLYLIRADEICQRCKRLGLCKTERCT